MPPDKVSLRESDAFAHVALVLARGLAQPNEFSDEDCSLAAEIDLSPSPELAAARDQWIGEWRKLMTADREPSLLAYARLFLGPYNIQVSPYASHYIDPQKRLMGETTQWVAERYAACGITPPEDRPADAPDHLALECEFLYFLGYQWHQSGDPTWLDQIDTFLDDHFLQWAPDCAAAIKAADTSLYYKALATFMEIWLKEIR